MQLTCPVQLDLHAVIADFNSLKCSVQQPSLLAMDNTAVSMGSVKATCMQLIYYVLLVDTVINLSMQHSYHSGEFR